MDNSRARFKLRNADFINGFTGREVASLIRREMMRVDGFPRCSHAIGAPVDKWDLIEAIAGCIFLHVRGVMRPSAYRRSLLLQVKHARKAAGALDTFLSIACSRRGIGGGTYSWADLEGVIERLTDIADFWEDVGKEKDDPGGRGKMIAFSSLVLTLADCFVKASGNPARVTYDKYLSGYKGQFWDLVETVLPIVRTVIVKIGGMPMVEPNSESARGKFIERVMDKTRTA